MSEQTRPIVFIRNGVQWRLMATQDGPFDAMDRDADDTDLRECGYVMLPSEASMARTLHHAIGTVAHDWLTDSEAVLIARRCREKLRVTE